jgi:1,4-alpha-glucan branching enzyme
MLYNKYGSLKKNNGYEFKVFIPDVDNVELKIKDKYFQMFNEDNVWTAFIDNLDSNTEYAYKITKGSRSHEKSDPYSRYVKYDDKKIYSLTYESKYKWISDNKYNKKYKNTKILEVLLQEVSGENYVDKAYTILNLLKNSNYTHIEVMPIMPYAIKKTLGYLPFAFFSVESMFGNPDNFKEFVDLFHQNGYGVIMDFVMLEFNEIDKVGGLHNFNFNYMYNKESGLKHEVFGGYIFGFEKPLVREFLLSSINFFINEFRIDGFRLDGVNEIIFKKSIENSIIKEPEISYMREFLSKIKDVIIIVENITSIHNDIIKLPNIDVIEGSLWMYDTLNLLMNNMSYRSKSHFNNLYSKKEHLYQQNLVSVSLIHDLFINGIELKLPYSHLKSKEDLLLLLKAIYAFNKFPKILYFDIFNDFSIKQDFKEFIDIYDSLDLYEAKFNFLFNQGVMYYTYKKDNKKYNFYFNITNQDRELYNGGKIIYPQNRNILDRKLKPYEVVLIEV